MIWLCVGNRDFSPLLPLKWKDLIYLQVFGGGVEEMEKDRRLVFDDIRFFLFRLSACFTGDVGMDHLPTNVAAMARIAKERERLST